MPRPAKGVRLWLRKERRNKAGKLISASAWIILDGTKHIATGCAPSEIGRAESALSQYIAEKYDPRRNERDIEEIDVADVLMVYDTDFRAKQEDPRKFDGRMARLNLFWGGKKLSEVTGATCREYAATRGNAGGARRDLEDLRSAINHHAKEGFHRGVVRVVLPPKGQPKDRWFTREEAAKLIRTCWRAREVQTLHRGKDRGQKVETDKRPLRHLARFILIGLYTGTRAGAIATASPVRQEGRSFVDLERGIYYRLAQGKKATNKRQPPAPIPARLLAHMRRWQAKGIAKDCFVEWNGKPVASVKTAFASAIEKAKLEHASPHTLRHTAATWLMQAGAPIWEASGFLGMSEKTLRETYGHHHPDFMRGAADAISNRPRKQVSLVVSLETARNERKNGV